MVSFGVYKGTLLQFLTLKGTIIGKPIFESPILHIVGSGLQRFRYSVTRKVAALPPLRLKHRCASVLIGFYNSGGLLVKR